MRTTRAFNPRAPVPVAVRADQLVDGFEKIATDVNAVLRRDPDLPDSDRKWWLEIDGCARHGKSHIVSQYWLTFTGGPVHTEAVALQQQASKVGHLH